MESLQANPSSPAIIGGSKWWSKETTAIVTGANRGIGYYLAKTLAESGLSVVLTARDPTKGLKAVQTLRDQGLHAHFGSLDVSDPASISAFAAWFKLNFGVLDILVNNAAISFNGVHENSVKHADIVMTTNFYGPKKLIEALLPLFRRSPTKSRILNISSRLGLLDRTRNPTIKVTLGDEENLTEERIEGVVKKFLEQVNNGTWESEGWPETWTDYAVSKMALNAHSKLLARRIKDSNIVVNCFCPGFTQTSMTGGKGSRTADVAARIAASVVLAQPEQLQTGKFVMGDKLSLVSKF
ncbi:hypothetical protein Droror1_Dr00017117 [Drosera rotundifolia]